MSRAQADQSIRPLLDGPTRDYVRKLELFTRFAEPELRAVIEWLGVSAGARVLDAGCGCGLLSRWIADAAAPGGALLAVDISEAHAASARVALRECPVPAAVWVADISRPSLPAASLDLVWCGNTLNHLADPEAALSGWRALLRPGGGVALGQSSFLPDMVFAWDVRLEAEVTGACRRFYREKYGLTEGATAGVRNLVGFLQRAGFREVTVRTFVIERTSPLRPVDTEYLLEAVFRGYWGARLRPYLSKVDWRKVESLCDPASPEFALARRDFHFLMTYTAVVGRP